MQVGGGRGKRHKAPATVLLHLKQHVVSKLALSYLGTMILGIIRITGTVVDDKSKTKGVVTRLYQLLKPSRGIEPRTFRLLGGCSTTEP
jgi:hypothetical protein